MLALPCTLTPASRQRSVRVRFGDGQVTTDIGRGVAIQNEFAYPKNTGIHQPMVGYARAMRLQRFGWGQIGVIISGTGMSGWRFLVDND